MTPLLTAHYTVGLIEEEVDLYSIAASAMVLSSIPDPCLKSVLAPSLTHYKKLEHVHVSTDQCLGGAHAERHPTHNHVEQLLTEIPRP